jgi:hypothetical protein
MQLQNGDVRRDISPASEAACSTAASASDGGLVGGSDLPLGHLVDSRFWPRVSCARHMTTRRRRREKGFYGRVV